MRDPLRAGIEPVSPDVAGGFFQSVAQCLFHLRYCRGTLEFRWGNHGSGYDGLDSKESAYKVGDPD